MKKTNAATIAENTAETMPPFATGRASARHKLAVAVKAPRSSMLPAVEMGWLAGLPDDELEVFMKDYLQAVALLFDVAQLDVAIRENKHIATYFEPVRGSSST